MSEQNGSTAIAIRAQAAPAVLDDESIETLRKTIAKELAPDEFSLFVQVAKRLGLSPLAKQIYALKVGGRMVLHVGIDGYRVLAERSRVYGGQLGPFWADAEGNWSEVWLKNEPPFAAKVGILRKDWKEPLWGVARFKSYQRESPNWKQQPDVMIAKAAEALAIRKAFPQELAGAPEYRLEYEGDPDDALADASEEYERLTAGSVDGEHREVDDVTPTGTDLAANKPDVVPEELKRAFADLVDEIKAAVPTAKAKLPGDDEPLSVWQERYDSLRSQWDESEHNPRRAQTAGRAMR